MIPARQHDLAQWLTASRRLLLSLITFAEGGRIVLVAERHHRPDRVYLRDGKGFANLGLIKARHLVRCDAHRSGLQSNETIGCAEIVECMVIRRVIVTETGTPFHVKSNLRDF